MLEIVCDKSIPSGIGEIRWNGEKVRATSLHLGFSPSGAKVYIEIPATMENVLVEGEFEATVRVVKEDW